MRHGSPSGGTLFPWFLFFVSLVLLRWQIVRDLKLDVAHAREAGLYLGLVYDAAAATLAFGIGRLLGVLPVWPLLTMRVSLILVWLAVAGNTIYFRFFNAPLEWWTVTLQWRDLYEVYGSAGALGSSALIIASAVLAFGAAMLAEAGYGWSFGRVVERGVMGACLVALALFIKQSPVWTKSVYVGHQHRGSIVSNQVLFRWWSDVTRKYADAPVRRGDGGLRPREQAKQEAPAALAAYRDHRGAGDPFAYGAASTTQHGPLEVGLAPDKARTKALREALGLPVDKPISVVFLFVESLRLYEVLHPEIGPAIYPHLRSVLLTKSLFFKQSYASGLTAGQTVRGQFSTQCSMLPDSSGPATYLAYPTVSVRCLPSLLKEQGYQTLWMNSFKTTFHNKGLFESLHGTDVFFDETYYAGKGIHQRIGQWGYADEPFLLESLRTLEARAAQGPFYVNMLTISSHHPFSVIPEGPLPPDVSTPAARAPEYAGYLSRFHYVDQALGKFFDAWFKSPLSKTTLLVLLGDHSVNVRPYFDVDPFRYQEVLFRIPIAFVTGGLKEPRVFDAPAHQIDIAPTVADILGLKGDVTWLGRSLLKPAPKGRLEAREGSEFVFDSGAGLDYRSGATLCHTLPGRSRPVCRDASGGRDALFDTLPELAETPDTTARFRDIVRSNSEVLHYDLVRTK